MKLLCFTLMTFLSAAPALAHFDHQVSVPKMEAVSFRKKPFIDTVSALSRNVFPETRSAIAPFGGVKVTPFAELDLQELVIVTNSYPGTPDEIEKQFTSGRQKLTAVLRQSLMNGSMSTSDVLSVTTAAQILARLKLELGVKEVMLSYWVRKGSSEKNFSERTMDSEAEALATEFAFTYNGKKSRLVFISTYIQSDSHEKPGFPEILSAFVPDNGFQWVYLSADGLGHFSGLQPNGLARADEQLIGFLQAGGTVLLDYPTDKNYHTPQNYGGISFMNGRQDLEERGMERLQTIPVETSGIFGYCLHPGDEVRVYRKSEMKKPAAKPSLEQIGLTHRFVLN